MKYFLLSAIIIFLIINSSISEKNSEKEEEQLLFVYEHCRHGARAPNDKKNGLYNDKTKTDSYNIYWDKPGILTEYGKLQHFFLGLRNKYRYKNFIDFSKYNQKEMLLRTTGVKRCTESLYYQILGMYYTENLNINNSIEFNEEIYKYGMPPNIKNWKTDPIFVDINNKINEFLKNKKIEGINLTSFNSESKKLFNIKAIKNNFLFITQKCKNHEKYIKKQRFKYKEIIKNNFIDNYANKLKNIISFTDESYFYKRGIAKSLADHFISDYLNGRKELIELSEKTGINLNEFFKECESVYYFFMYNIYCFSKSCVLSASRLINEIINYFENAINPKNNKSKNIKMIIDLGHDVTVNDIQILMNKAFNINYTYCTFACNLYFGLFRIKRDNKYIIKYFENDLLLLKIEYSKFKKQLIKLLWTDTEIEKFCNGKKENIFKIHEEQDSNDNIKDINSDL